MPVKPILDTIRTAFIVPQSQVNYGWSQGLQPPYISVMDYESNNTYDTGGLAIRNSKWKVVVIDKSVDEAEALAAQVDALLDLSETVTPDCMRCFQDSYSVGQMDEKLYQWGVAIEYSMTEDLNKANED